MIVLSSDLAFRDFLTRVSAGPPRREVVVWSELRLINHLYDEETDRLRPFATMPNPPATTRRKRKAPLHHFTQKQLEIATASLARQTERETA